MDNQEPKFSTEDKIQLKSGTGPIMTCKPSLEPTPDRNFPNGQFRGRYWCTWYDEEQKKFIEQRLGEDVLKKVD